MNEFQTKIFTELEALVKDSETFYRQEFALDGKLYWIYNYRLSTYTEFLKPSALECRGHMFEVDASGNAIRLAALPMPKFFNLNENPMTMDLDLTKVDTVESKVDGSLISTYLHDNQLRLKTKGSLFSDQAVAAMKWISRDMPGIFGFRKVMEDCERAGWTVNLEWCAPDNRIVIGYEFAHLKVLNVRNRSTGEFMSREQMGDLFYATDLVDRVDTKGLDVAAFVQSIPAMQDNIEGYVGRIGILWFKVKTEKYLSLHHAKDSVNNPRRLFEAIVDEAVDDLRSLFATDALAMKQIDEMQEKVTHLFNHMVATVENFYETNKHLERKWYAIKGRDVNELDQLYFGLCMNKYLGKPVDYKAFAKSKYKEFGFKDETVIVEDE